MASNTAPSSIITQVSTGASLTSNDVIGETIRTGRSESILDCKCHSTKDRKGNRGTVQCSTWSHLACYKLLTKETKSSSFTFVCETCTTNPPVPCLTLSQPIPKTRLRALSEPPADKRSSPSAATCSDCSEVPKLREAVNELSLLVRSLRLQIITLRDRIEKPQPPLKKMPLRLLPIDILGSPSTALVWKIPMARRRAL